MPDEQGDKSCEDDRSLLYLVVRFVLVTLVAFVSWGTVAWALLGD